MLVICMKKVKNSSVDFVTKYTTDNMKSDCMKVLTQARSPLCVIFGEKHSVGRTVYKDTVNCMVIRKCTTPMISLLSVINEMTDSKEKMAYQNMSDVYMKGK